MVVYTYSIMLAVDSEHLENVQLIVFMYVGDIYTQYRQA